MQARPVMATPTRRRRAPAAPQPLALHPLVPHSPAQPLPTSLPHLLRYVLGCVAATLLAALLACLLARPAGAANLQISPVSIQFARGQGAAGITLQNGGDDALFGQVRVYVWDQRDGQDVLTPASDLVASPPVMEIPARSSQTIRLVRRGSASGEAGERSYRILIDELPRGEQAGGVAIRLQYSVPVFAAPALSLSDSSGAAPRLSWDVYRKDGAWMLRVHNDGALHAQIGATVLRGPDGKDLQVSKGLLGYALAGKTREWRLPVDGALELGAPGTALALSASVNAQPVSAGASVRRE